MHNGTFYRLTTCLRLMHRNGWSAYRVLISFNSYSSFYHFLRLVFCMNTVQPPKHILDHLSQDPILKKLIGLCELKPRPGQPTVYEALIRSINFQQLSGEIGRASCRERVEMR